MKSFALTPLALLTALLASCHAPSEQASAKDSGSPQPGPPPSAPMNVTPLPAASVAAYINPAHLPPYNGPTGSVEGTIRIDGPPAPETKGVDFSTCPDGARMYGHLFREGAPGADGSRPLADAIVAITGYQGYYIPERKEAATLTIDDCAFASRTVAMTFGQRLEIANNSGELWAPMLTQAPMPVLMMATAHGDPVRLYPPHPGYYTLVDKGKHFWAQADVYALLHPLHAVSDASGHYRIDGVPVGKLKVNARLAALQRDASADVEVLAGVVQTADLVLHYTPAPVASADAGAKPHIIP
ncbi:MAG: carboxypeptidase-like regulatory domain-containing protein [Polyangiaceae bacterium]